MKNTQFRILALIAGILMSAVTFTACDKDDDKGDYLCQHGIAPKKRSNCLANRAVQPTGDQGAGKDAKKAAKRLNKTEKKSVKDKAGQKDD